MELELILMELRSFKLSHLGNFLALLGMGFVLSTSPTVFNEYFSNFADILWID